MRTIYQVNTFNDMGITSHYMADPKEYAVRMLTAKMQDKNYVSSRAYTDPIRITQSVMGGEGMVNVYLPSDKGMELVGKMKREELEHIVGEELPLREMVEIPFMTQYVRDAISPFLSEAGRERGNLYLVQ